MRLIDASPLEKRLKNYQRDCQEANDIVAARVFADAITELQDCATINPEDLRTKGRWEPIGDDDMDEGYYKCTSCGYEIYFYSGDQIYGQKYCPYCGAKMDK